MVLVSRGLINSISIILSWQTYSKNILETLSYSSKMKTIHNFNHRKVPNFWTPENFAIIYLNQEKRPNFCIFCKKDANGIVNSEDPDQTAPLGAV